MYVLPIDQDVVVFSRYFHKMPDINANISDSIKVEKFYNCCNNHRIVVVGGSFAQSS